MMKDQEIAVTIKEYYRRFRRWQQSGPHYVNRHEGSVQHWFPPIKMLVIVCLFVVIFETVFHLHKDVVSLTFNDQSVSKVIEWINSQKSWATLLVNSLFILPTWLVFRYAPAYPRHTLPEGFFLQVFLSVLLIGS